MTWFLVVALVTGAAPPPSAQEIALTLTVILSATSPLWLKVANRWLDGPAMSVVALIASFLIAGIAEWLVGNFSLTREGILSILQGSGEVFIVQQFAYQALKQWWPTMIAPPAPKPTPVVPVKVTPPPP